MNQRSRGFTLLELVLTVAIAMVLLSVGIPSFQQVTKQNKLATEANNLLLNINHARSEAIKRTRMVVMCKSANITASEPSCTTSNDWSQGWLIFEDKDRDNAVDSDELPPLRIQSALGSGLALEGLDEFADVVIFSPDGSAKGDEGTRGGTFELCSGDSGRQLTINNVGRPTMTKVSCEEPS